MKLGFDLDSVLNELDEAWEKWIRENYEPNFTMEQVKSWAMHEHTTAGKEVYDFLHLPGTFRNLGVRDDAQAVLRRLQEAGHELFVLTSTIPSTWECKVAWLLENFPFIPSQNIMATSCKGMVRVDVLLDDGLHNFSGFRGRPVIFDRPWNRTGASRRMLRVGGFKQFEKLILWMEGKL